VPFKPGKHTDPDRPKEDAVVRALRPYRQGTLDSYCGLYAIINAMLRLKPQAFIDDDDGACDLFYAMMKAAVRICTPEELCGEGMDSIELEYVAKAGIRHMRRKGHAFKLMRPEKMRFGSATGDLGEWLRSAQGIPSLAVILYVEERQYSHWSVLKGMSASRVALFDSDSMSSVSLKRCEPALVLSSCLRAN
jgi:hypothetical protein